jgi:transposase-like protein
MGLGDLFRRRRPGGAGSVRAARGRDGAADERDRLKALEREKRELRRANEILRKASAYFAQAELDRRFKP